MVLAPLTTASRYSGEADASAAPQASGVAREPGWDRAYAHGELSLTNLDVLLGADSVLCSVGCGLGGERVLPPLVPGTRWRWGASRTHRGRGVRSLAGHSSRGSTRTRYVDLLGVLHSGTPHEKHGVVVAFVVEILHIVW